MRIFLTKVFLVVSFPAILFLLFLNFHSLFSDGISNFSSFYSSMTAINSVIFGVVLALLLVSYVPKLRPFSGTGIYISSWIMGISFWVSCVYITFELWGLIGLFAGIVFFGIGVFATAALALLFKGMIFQFLMLLLTIGLIYAFRVLGFWIAASAEDGNENTMDELEFLPKVAVAIIVVYIIVIIGFFDSPISVSNGNKNRAEPDSFASLNNDELGIFLGTIKTSSERPLAEVDLENLRIALRNYTSRTGKYLTREGTDRFFSAAEKTNEYQYELGQSIILSWNKKEMITTDRFKELYEEMQDGDYRKPDLLQADKNMIQKAASGRIDRETIVENNSKIDTMRDNFIKITEVVNEFVK